jgi:superfamily II DNA helicase RecQ
LISNLKKFIKFPTQTTKDFSNNNNKNSKRILVFKVEYKTSNQAALEKIIDLIKSKYSNKSGIVYCISRNECESVCDHLRKNGIKG